jgi:cold shock CspA family protein
MLSGPYKTLAENDAVEMEVTKGTKGLQDTKVVKI